MYQGFLIINKLSIEVGIAVVPDKEERPSIRTIEIIAPHHPWVIGTNKEHIISILSIV